MNVYEDFFWGFQEKGIETFEKTQPDGKTKQVFFFDPDGKSALKFFLFLPLNLQMLS